MLYSSRLKTYTNYNCFIKNKHKAKKTELVMNVFIYWSCSVHVLQYGHKVVVELDLKKKKNLFFTANCDKITCHRNVHDYYYQNLFFFFFTFFFLSKRARFFSDR